jgi:3-oxoacyl-[acyl-carrier-protein] synthase II
MLMADKKKVVITGLGIITAQGLTVNEYFNNLLAGKSAVKKITRFDASDLPSQIGSEITNYNPEDYMDKKLVKRVDRFIHYALPAADQAVSDAGLDKATGIDKDRVGIIFGSGIGGIEVFGNTAVEERNESWKKVSPFFIPSLITNMAGGQIAIKYGFRGPNYSISTACASATHSVIEAYNAIIRGDADIMVTGGTEAPLTSLGYAGFCKARALSTRNDEPEKASRPFDVGRDGFVMGEGAGAIILESEASAVKRGAKIYGYFVGGGMSCDAYHMTAPCEDGSGAALAMSNAINNSGLSASDIQLINTHGTSTPLGDIAEVTAIKRVFQDNIKGLKINSTKSMIGHLLGGAGAAELVAVAKMVETGKVHPTINVENQDPACDIDCVANKAIDMDIKYAMSNSFGFGGQNAAVIVGKYNG